MKLSRCRANSLLTSVALLAAAPALAAPPTIAMYGDSTTRGYIGYGFSITDNNEPAYLSYSFWNGGVPRAYVENHGIGGITCLNLLNGGGYVPRNWWQEMSLSTAAIITINLGMNDAAYGETGKQTYTNCLGVLIDVARGYHKTVVIETPNPRLAGATGNEGVEVGSYASAAIGEASNKGVFYIDQWSYETLYYDWQTHVSPNGVHPDDAMYAYKAGVAFGVLNPLIDALAR